MKKRPAVGVAVIIVQNKKVLLGKRLNSHGEGTWAFPGGHLEMNESIEACAKREVFEETGLSINNVTRATFTNDIFKKEGKHYITVFVTARIMSGTPRIMEPEKCEKWEWYGWNKLPCPRFLSLQNLLEQGFAPDM